MQGHSWGWDTVGPHNGDTETSHWQGQWESHGCGESSGWGVSSWDQSVYCGNAHYEEFENIMRWDDSGALEALEVIKKLNEEQSHGLMYSVSLPSPDLYIQAIDWNSHEDLKLPDPGGTFSPPQGERRGQRKRGRKAMGGFRRQFDREEASHVADWKQSGKPCSETIPCTEVKAAPEEEHVNAGGSSSTQFPQDIMHNPSRRAWSPTRLQASREDHGRSNWSVQWSSPHQKQSPDRHDYGKSQINAQPKLQSHVSQHTWRPTDVPSQARAWGHEGAPYWSSYGISNEVQYQAAPMAPGNDWMRRHEPNMPGFTHQPFSTGLRPQQVPMYVPDKSRKWRPQQQANRRWR